MSFIQQIVLSVIQGLTEFLPVSSSGHLILVSWLFNWPDQGFLFDVAVHVGTLSAVVIYFRREWLQLLLGLGSNQLVEVDDSGVVVKARTLALLIIIGTIPLAIAGLMLSENVFASVRAPEVVGWLLIGTAAVLFLGEMLGSGVRKLGTVTPTNALFIGLVQVTAFLPGISRSGVTMAAGLALGMTRDAAARFSMLLAAPAITGAGLLVALRSSQWSTEPELGAMAVGALLSAGTAYVAIAWLLRLLRTGSFRPFIFYCLTVGVGVVVVRAVGV
jgi:undecaprenyl-diphosphatase